MENISEESFLDKNFKVVFQPLVLELLEQRPEEPIKFMIEWLQKYSGINVSQNMEKTELENLRKEMSRYKKKYKIAEGTNELVEKLKSHKYLISVMKHNDPSNDKSGPDFTSILRTKSTFNKLQQLPLDSNKELTRILTDAFDSVSPLIYLSTDQKRKLSSCLKFVHFKNKGKIFCPDEEDGKYAYLLLKGEIFIYNSDLVFEDYVNDVCLFGYDGPIFRSRGKIALANDNTYLGVIEAKDFLQLIVPFSKYSMYLSRVIIYKDKTLDCLNDLKTYILSHINRGPIDLIELTGKYMKINSCLHPKAHSLNLDVNAWSYALNRLPVNIFETLQLVMINVTPKILTMRDDVHLSLISPVKTKARMRDTFRYLNGKNVVFVRELETDVMDFIANMCIHIVECWKIRKNLYSLYTIEALYYAGDNFNQTIDVINKHTALKISSEDAEVLYKCFGSSFSKKMINIMLHYQDYNITINKIPQNNLDSVEKWTQNLWINAKRLLNVNSSVDEVGDLVVDIIQGSKRTLIGCISPHLHKNAKEIMKWAKFNGIKTQTKIFNNEVDKLLAYAYHYYKAFPEKQKEKDDLEAQHGIQTITETYGTGIGILLVNVNKLDPKYVDSNLTLKPASKHHLLLHIGYTFGAQSSAIIKPLLMLFGSKARSMNIIGKAGGLEGNRTDILVANKMFYDKTHELCTINTGDINEAELRNDTKSGVNIGPMLTVAGTILQNNDLLYFYKYVMGCVGLEMEGFFFVKEIDNAIRHGLLPKTFVTRCFYYASDLPLDPTQNLSMEDGNVSWDEGVGSMNAIMRFVFKKIFSNK